MWDYDLAKAIKARPSDDFERVWYKAVYSGGSWYLMGGRLRFSGDAVLYCASARTAKLYPRNGMETWVLFDQKQNKILILDVIG